jgi:hypothetical protein
MENEKINEIIRRQLGNVVKKMWKNGKRKVIRSIIWRKN